jgi:eukaryotic-like serine/threonine-protein kinase
MTQEQAVDDLVNKTLGQFQITRELGRGGMAVVYQAYQPALQRQVALKVLPPSLAQDDFVRRFQHEAIAAAGLRHPNIVTIYDVGSEDRYNYIVMEFLEGRPLSDVIRAGGPMPLARICKIIEQVAQALDYAHQHGFIHRDIKPSNVMLDQADHATLTDFGIARALTGTHLTQTGTLIGTPEYMSPEQVTGEEIDARTDVYSLGIVAYEMVTGQVPFSGTTASVLYRQANTPPPPLRTHVPGVNPTVENVILRALAKRRDERYATAGQFAQALTAALAGQPVAMPTRPTPPTITPPPAYTPPPTYTPPQPMYTPPPTAPRTVGSSRGLLWVLAGGAALVFLCVVIAAIAWIASRGHPTTQPTETPRQITQASPTAPPAPTLRPTTGGGGLPPTYPSLTPTPTSSEPRLAFATGPEGAWQIMLADVTTGRIESLPNQPANSGVPAWSRDHTRLAFRSKSNGSWQVYTINVNGAGLRQITQVGNNTEANWSPDGTQLVYVSDRDSNKELYITDAAGRQHRRLTNNAVLDDDPNWSPDGQWIVFERKEGDCFNLYVIQSDGSGERALTRNTGEDCAWSSTPAWSPDSKWIAYEQSAHGRGYRIAVMDANGSNARFVTQGGAEGVNDVRPAWSPDGKWIAYSSDRSGGDGIYIVSAGGGQPRRIDTSGGFDPAW